MPAGFQIIGSHGAVQVDENYVNLGLVAKGTVSIPAGFQGNAWPAPQIIVNGATPVLCIRPLSTFAAIRRVQKSGNAYSYTIQGGYASGDPTSPLAETFNWYLFDRMALTTVGSSGIQVFNGTGEITFNSSANPMRVAAVGKIPDASMATASATVNAAASGIYAACLSQGRIDSGAMGPNLTGVFTEAVKLSATGATTAPSLSFVIPVETAVQSYQGGQILLVDVSGL